MVSSPSMKWTGYLVIVAWVALLISVPMVRAGIVSPGLMALAFGALLGTLLFIVLLILKIIPKANTPGGEWGKRLLASLPLALLFGSLLLGNRGIPPIHDISTDTETPPVFTRAPELRGPNANPLDIKPDSIAQQREAYPDLAPMTVSLDGAAAYDKALATARALGWEVYYEAPDKSAFEAVDSTFFMDFKDDIAVRVTPSAAGSTIDLRSVSRVGVSDVGANAKRIRRFAEAFNQ